MSLKKKPQGVIDFSHIYNDCNSEVDAVIYNNYQNGHKKHMSVIRLPKNILVKIGLAH